MSVHKTPSVLELLASENIFSIIRAGFFLFAGLVVAMVVRRTSKEVLSKYFSPQQVMLIQRIVGYIIFGIFVTLALNALGISLSVLLGAAGIITVALGFAAQTSVSNIISGIFLIGEKPFSVDDHIEVDGTEGLVLSIDLLSVRLRTFQNLLVRIPNETMLKSKVINYTRFPIRRLDITLNISHREDIERVKQILFHVADRNHLCFEDPKPVFKLMNYGEYSMQLVFCVWTKTGQFLELRNTMYDQIKNAFHAHGVQTPIPQRIIHSNSSPMPVG